eukprot:CAMPEP_0113463978 /NCGR_PEP_ID=MMETSP0014_2-20120614/12951_1 /TAXON_ID=2857 /ORGANISM="Nitzschia sp." /LENGTH=673 /DNA_ID=CAMNT_0000356019 /DNA_START=130 /DNA_END=2148 /DNA_ORIENTATION=- /assembly_acc=CAM_ASM_000159
MYYLLGRKTPPLSPSSTTSTSKTDNGDSENIGNDANGNDHTDIVNNDESTVSINNNNNNNTNRRRRKQQHQQQQQQQQQRNDISWDETISVDGGDDDDDDDDEHWKDEETPPVGVTPRGNDDETNSSTSPMSMSRSRSRSRSQIFSHWFTTMMGATNREHDDKNGNRPTRRPKTLHLNDVEKDDRNSKYLDGHDGDGDGDDDDYFPRKNPFSFKYVHIRRQMQLLVLLLVVSAFTAGFLLGSLVQVSRMSVDNGTTPVAPPPPPPPPTPHPSHQPSQLPTLPSPDDDSNTATNQTIPPTSLTDGDSENSGSIGQDNNATMPSYPENDKPEEEEDNGNNETLPEDDTDAPEYNDGEVEDDVTVGAPGSVRVGAYYYPWYGDDFHRGDGYIRKELQPPQPPMLGEYNDRDPEVISKHLSWSRQANIDLWITSWWGPDSREDQTLKDVILKHPDLVSSRHRISIFYETTGRIKESEGYSTQRVGPDLEYLCNAFFNHPNYLRIDEKPVMFVYLTRKLESHSETLLPTVLDEMRTAAQSAGCGEIFIVGDHVFQGPPGLEEVVPPVSLLDGVTNYDVYGSMGGKGGYAGRKAVMDHYSEQRDWRTYAKAEGCAFLPSASPGYNDLGVRPEKNNKPLSRRLQEDDKEGSLFELALQQARTLIDPAALNLLIINSFNEW